MRRFASLSLCATVAISDSISRPACGLASAIIGSACNTAKLVSGALAATRSASSIAFGSAPPASVEILRKAVGRAFGGGIDPAGQHHVGHPRHADQPRQPHRSAAADEDTALALGQREIGARLGDADMRGTGQLQPAADHRALQRGDDRHAAVLDAVEHPVPHLRVAQALGGVVLGQFGQVEAGREMIADAVDDNGADVVGQIGEAILDREDDAVIERIALGRPVEPHGQHRA